MLSGHIREPGHSKFINRPLHNCLRRPLFHLWEHNGQAPSPRLLLWYTTPQEPHTGTYYLWIYHGLLDDSFTTALFLQMQLMLPLVIRADSGFYGSEDWSTRLDCVCVPKWKHFLRARPCLTSLFRWRVVAQGAMGGFLLLSVMQAVSRWTNIPLIMFRYVPLSHILQMYSAIIFLCRLPLGDSTAIFFSSPAITMILSFFLLK